MKLIEILKNVLGKPDASSSDLRSALAQIDIGPLETAVISAERARAGLLLNGTEAQLDKADEALKLAVRERDRALAAQAALSQRLTEAEVTEMKEALDAERAAVEKEAKTVAKLLTDKWPSMQAEMVAILERLGDAEAAVREINARLVAAGRADNVLPVEERAFPIPKTLYAPVFSIREHTAFRSLGGVPGWPNGDLIDQIIAAS